MRPGCLRLGIVTSYPTGHCGSVDGAGELVRALARDHDVVVCAVGRPGPQYPDEVVAVIARENRDDYRRAGRIMAEYGVDLVLIRYDDGVLGGPAGAHVLDLAHELRLHGIRYAVELPAVRADTPTAWVRSVAALTMPAVGVVAASDPDRDLAVARGLARRDRIRVLSPGVPQDLSAVLAEWVAANPGSPPSLGAVHPRIDWVERRLGDVALPSVATALAVVTAGLLALPPDRLTPSGWSAATVWAGRSVRALGISVQDGQSSATASRAVLGLGAIAASRGVAEPLRHRASVLRGMLVSAPPANLLGAADVVLGLVEDARGEAELAALRCAALRLDDTRRQRERGALWPGFGDRLEAHDIHLARALVAAGTLLVDDAMTRRGLQTLDWLARRAGLAMADGVLRPLTAGPQWSVEAAAFVQAMVTGFRVTRAGRYARWAVRCLEWFHGANATGDLVYDPDIGACRAGLGPAAALRTETVEATLAYLGAALAAHGAGLVEIAPAELSRQDLAAVA